MKRHRSCQVRLSLAHHPARPTILLPAVGADRSERLPIPLEAELFAVRKVFGHPFGLILTFLGRTPASVRNAVPRTDLRHPVTKAGAVGGAHLVIERIRRPVPLGQM